MKNFLLKNRFLSLLFIAILSGIFWRMETEYYGIRGLGWFYTSIHISPIISLILTTIWFNIQLVSSNKFFIFLSGFVYATILYLVIPHQLYVHGRMGFIFPIFIICNIPLGAFFILKFFQENSYFKKLLLSYLLMIISFPVTELLVYCEEILFHTNGSYFVFTSGYLIPFWIVALGILVFKKKEN